MARVTLTDVARAVGVSAKSVSNVVNGTGWVSEQTRQRILDAIRELGYRPNAAARQLRTGSSGMLALGVPDLREPYFAEFASRFVSAAQERNITVLVTQTGGERVAECALIEGEALPAVDGVVMSPLAITASDLVARHSEVPLVLIGEHGGTIAAAPTHHVGVDNVAATAAATAYLIERGRRRIAAIGVQHQGSTATSAQRFEGYRRALEAADLPLDDRLLGVVDDFNRAEGSRVVDELIRSGLDFDGLVCFNDTLAFGALYSLGVRGRHVPDDVDVVGFDNIDEGRFSIPPFATVDPGVDQASQLILDILADPGKYPGGHLEVDYKVVERE